MTGGRRPTWRMLVGILVALVVAGAASSVPAAGGAFRASILNSAGKAGTAPYFTCKEAYLASSPTVSLALTETSNSSTATDFSPGANASYVGSMVSDRTTATACPRDPIGTYVLNGSTSALYTPTLRTGPNVFTLEIWFKTTTGGGKLIGFGASQTGASSTYDRHLYLSNSGQVVFGVYPNAVKTVASTATYLDGRWHQAVGTLSAAGMVLYVDGVQVASDPTTTSAQSFVGYWRVGYDNLSGWGATQPTNFSFTGSLRFAGVFSVALTAAQVASHYRAGT